MKNFVLCLSILSSSLQAKELIPNEYTSSLLSKYSQEEKTLILEDLNVVRSVTFKNHSPSQNKVYLATAGSPLSRKSTILEEYISTHPEFKNAVYLDPDQRGLKFMTHTYISKSLNYHEVYKKQDLQKVRSDAYTHWREASNYITNTLLNEAFQKNYDIAHGTTLTGNATPLFLKSIKEAGYKITLILCFASDKFKKETLKYRNEQEGFYQVTEEDFIEKAKLFPKQFQTYINLADHLEFYWNDRFGSKIEPAATWSKEHGLKILNKDHYKKITNQHPQWERGVWGGEGTVAPQ